MKQVRYITDSSGNKTEVVVPFVEWEAMAGRYRKLQNKVKVLQGITSSLKEIRQAGRKGEELQTLDSFLRESNC